MQWIIEYYVWESMLSLFILILMVLGAVLGAVFGYIVVKKRGGEYR